MIAQAYRNIMAVIAKVPLDYCECLCYDDCYKTISAYFT